IQSCFKMNKPKVIKDFLKLDEEIQEQILEQYPNGYEDSLILFTDRDGKYAQALPYETEDKFYLLRMPQMKAKKNVLDAEGASAEEEEEEDGQGGYTDLDTMQIGGTKRNDDDEGYD
ncbi:MAG: hypothetical protein LRY55_00635, partial [Leadbetterella sp.]|nr:hypothetical protein [Leadbetterella sp.]